MNTTTKILFENESCSVSRFSFDKEECDPENSSIKAKGESLEGLTISHQYCTATLSLHGGQVLSFKPNGHEDIFWLSKTSNYKTGTAIRGGIPLCWPWFGRLEQQSPSTHAAKHGFARLLNWQITEVNADEQGVNIVLTLTGNNQHPLWPNSYRLTQRLFFGKKFKQTLTMTNLSNQDTGYSAVFHNYFNVSNPSNIDIPALTGASYYDQLSQQNSVQEKLVNCIGEIDRNYNSCADISIVDNKLKRIINIKSDNCQHRVLWNPGTSLATTMDDIHDGGENEYVCLEPGNVIQQTLPAGESITINQEISVIKL